MKKGGGGERISISYPVFWSCRMPMDDLALHRFLLEAAKQRPRIMGKKYLFPVRCLAQRLPSMDTRCRSSSSWTHHINMMNQTTFPREICGVGTICICFLFWVVGDGENMYSSSNRETLGRALKGAWGPQSTISWCSIGSRVSVPRWKERKKRMD